MVSLKVILPFLVAGVLLLAVPPAESAATLTSTYRWSRALSSTKAYTLHWNITSTTLYVGLTANVVGWMGFGPSPSGTMTGGDVAVTWVSGGTGFAYDYQTTGHTQPTLDSGNSVTFIAGSATASSYAIEYSRPLAAKSSSNIAINPFVNTQVIFALNSLTPPTSSTSFTKHDVLATTDTFCFCYTCTPPATPAAPMSPSAGSSWVFVTWTASTSDPLTPVTSYTLSMNSTAGGTFSTVYSGSGLSYNATGLLSGTKYGFELTATNVMGTSAASPFASFTTTVAPPLTPTNLTVVGATSTSVALTWTAPPSGAEPTTNYTVQYSLASPVSFSTAGISGVTSFNVTGLAMDTAYLFQVAASNAYGMGDFSSEVGFRTNTLNPTIVSTANLSIPIPSPTSSSAITIDWSPPSDDGGAQVLSYILEVSNVTTSPYSAYSTLYTGLALSYNHSGLWRDTTYQYRLAAVNSVGTSNFTAASVNATTLKTPPSAPRSLTTSSVSTKWMVLSWTAPVDDGGSPILAYNIFLNQSLVGSTAATHYNVTGLNPSSTYNFTVNATNAVGSGPRSSPSIFNTTDCASNADCSGQGTCSLPGGTCQCNSGYAGLYCQVTSGVGNLTPTIMPGEFNYSASALGGLYTLYWSFDSTTITFGIVVNGSGWIGLGFGGQMAGADIIIGSIGSSGIVTANDYYGTGETTPTLDTTLGGTNGIISYNGNLQQTASGPVATFKFSRLILSNDTYDASLDVSTSAGPSNIIIAFNPSTTTLDYHGANYREALQVNWATGAVSVAPLPAIRIAHGALMAFGWLGILFGALCARYIRWAHRERPGDALWFSVHRANQMFWFLVIVAGFVLAFVANTILKAAHLKSAHSIMGTIAVGLAVVQVVWALFRPHPVKDDEGRFLKKQPCCRVFWQFNHWWIGRGAILLSIATVLLGMYTLRAPYGVYIAYAFLLALIIVFIIYMELRMVAKQRQPPKILMKKMKPSVDD